MISAVAEEKEFKSLTIPHLKKCLNAEHNAFEKTARKEALDHYKEVNENRFVNLCMMVLHC